jgi:hypothetical protein
MYSGIFEKLCNDTLLKLLKTSRKIRIVCYKPCNSLKILKPSNNSGLAIFVCYNWVRYNRVNLRTKMTNLTLNVFVILTECSLITEFVITEFHSIFTFSNTLDVRSVVSFSDGDVV